MRNLPRPSTTRASDGMRAPDAGPDVGDAVPGNEDCVIRVRCARGDVDHRHVGDRDCRLAGGGSSASRRRQQSNRDYRTPYLVRLTRQFPVCGVFEGEPLVLNVPSIVSPFTVPVNVVTTGQSHWGSRYASRAPLTTSPLTRTSFIVSTCETLVFCVPPAAVPAAFPNGTNALPLTGRNHHDVAVRGVARGREVEDDAPASSSRRAVVFSAPFSCQ